MKESLTSQLEEDHFHVRYHTLISQGSKGRGSGKDDKNRGSLDRQEREKYETHTHTHTWMPHIETLIGAAQQLLN